MQALELGDVEQIVSLVAEAGDPTVELSLPERKRLVLEGTARLIDADVWIWSSAAPNPDLPGDVVTTCLIDGGWKDEREQGLVYEALSNVEFGKHILRKIPQTIAAGRYVTFRRDDLVSPEEWAAHGEPWNRTGFGYLLFTIYPLGGPSFSGIGFHRRAGKPDFGEREKTIVHVLFRQVDWLHRHGTHAAGGDKSFPLSPRERQVLVFLLRGDSQKKIAAKLEISEHTVGDYVKRLHKHFQVTSRAELQAYFYTGNPPDEP